MDVGLRLMPCRGLRGGPSELRLQLVSSLGPLGFRASGLHTAGLGVAGARATDADLRFEVVSEGGLRLAAARGPC